MAVLSLVDLSLLELMRAVEKTGYRFITTTPDSHQRVNARPDRQSAQDLRGVFGWSRRFNPAILPPGLFDLLRAANGVVADEGLWRSRYRISTINDGMFLHSAFPTQEADAVFFGPDTYRFVGALTQALGEATSWRRAADIGCGSGAAGILLARAQPGASVVMTDINPAALRLSAINAAFARASNVDIRPASLLDGIDGDFDLIVANPPYLLDRAKRLYRHGGGARGEGLSLAILDTALARLAPGGKLMLYTGVAIVDGIDAFREAVAGHP
jgi:hypothetical protein